MFYISKHRIKTKQKQIKSNKNEQNHHRTGKRRTPAFDRGSCSERDRKNTTKEEPAIIPEILNVEQVCRLLNMKRSTLYQKTHKSEIPFSKKGKALYFNRTEIYNWVAEGRILTEAELRENAITVMVQNNKRTNK